MARSMVLGNGNMSVCLDQNGQLRDLYFPYVGQENHIGMNQVHKIGIFMNNKMSWIDNGDWNTSVQYEEGSMVSSVLSNNNNLSIKSEDVVYNEKNIFLRKMTLTNNSSKDISLKLFYDQQFKISDTNHADTAYIHKDSESIIHYKGRRVFLVGGQCDGKSFDDYSIGFCGIEGKEGTWKDAEDGILSKNPIEHGIVDSVIGWNINIKSKGESVVYYWIIAGETYREVQEIRDYVIEKHPQHLIKSTRDFWYAWAHQNEVYFDGLSDKIKKLFYDSLFVMKAHSDSRGGIVASLDSGNVQYGGDTYVYVWPRDACFTSWAFDIAGFHDISKRFYNFASDVITEEGYVLHKYQPDRSLGSSWHPWVLDGKEQLAIQEDETAILIVGLWEYYIRSKDLEFAENLYNSFVKRALNFMISYKNNINSLPMASYDLWEEKHVVSVFTSSVVYKALISGYNFAKILGKEDDASMFYGEAEKIKKDILSLMWNEDKSFFFKLSGEDLKQDDVVDASSFYGIFKFGLLAPDDPRLKNAFSKMVNSLSKGNKIGGLARYEGDKYYKSNTDSVGNPWPIVSLWATQYKISLAESRLDMNSISKDLDWVANTASFSMFGEQLDPTTGAILSAKPLVWSHAEFVRTVVEYSQKYKILYK